MADNATSSVTALQGKTTIDDKMFFEPCRLSYQSADGIAEKIAREVQGAAKGKTVVIAGTPLLADFTNLQAVYLVLESLQSEYETLVNLATSLGKRLSPQPEEVERSAATDTPTPFSGLLSGVIAPATSLVSGALGLVSLFRQDVEYHGIKTVVDPLAFEIALSSKVKSAGAAKVFVPDLMAVSLAEPKEGSLRARLEKVQSSKARAWAAVGPLISKLVRLDAELDQAARDENQELFDRLSVKVSEMRRDMQPVSDPLSRADQRLADLQNQWNQVSEPSGLSQLARLLRAEAIHAMKPLLYLHAQVVSSGGHHRISRNLFRMLFLGDGLSFAGGAIVRWALLDNDGSVASGGIFTVRRNSKLLTVSGGSE